jgi:hypothetical protein
MLREVAALSAVSTCSGVKPGAHIILLPTAMLCALHLVWPGLLPRLFRVFLLMSVVCFLLPVSAACYPLTGSCYPLPASCCLLYVAV